MMKPCTSGALLGGVSAVALMVAVAGGTAGAAAAQSVAAAGDGAVRLEPIVITGEKVERSLQHTASSVTALSAKDIDETVGAAVSDVIDDVPNVLYTGTVGAPIIRGQDTQGPNFGSTAFFAGTIPRASINLDGRYLSYYEYAYGATSVWDVDSIEVFRGPQTTTQGANSIAGAIVVNTKDPTFTPEASYLAEYGNYNARRAALALSGPIVGDELAARVAIDHSGRNTFIDYTNPAFAAGESNLDFRTLNVRGKLLWAPEALPDLTAKLTFSHHQSNRPTWETASAPYEDLDNATGSMPSWEERTNTLIGDVTYEIADGVLLSNQAQRSSLHVDRVITPYTNGAAVIDQTNLSNETRVTVGRADDTLSGMAGVFVSHTTSDETLYIRGVSDFDDTKDQLGLFSELTYRLTARWRVTGGLRYQRDHIQRSGTSSYARGPLNYDETFDAWLPKLSLAYDVNPDATVGAMVSRGYNPGGVNLRFVTGAYAEFDPETVWNYELFGRARFLDDRLHLTGNLFYADYENSQRLLPDYLNGVLYGSYVVNADRATAYGLEVGMGYQLLDSVRLRAGAGLLETEVNSFTSAGGTVYEGNAFSRAPSYTLSLGVDWDVTDKLRLTGEVRHTDGYHSTDENTPAYQVDAYTIANARIAYQAFEHAEIYAFVNNIFDERVESYFYDDRSVGGIVANMLEPRMFGVGVKGTF